MAIFTCSRTCPGMNGHIGRGGRCFAYTKNKFLMASNAAVVLATSLYYFVQSRNGITELY